MPRYPKFKENHDKYESMLDALQHEYVEYISKLTPEEAQYLCKHDLLVLPATIEVRGGVAELTECPKEVEVIIIDHDNKEG